MTTVLPDGKFEVLCDDSEFVLSTVIQALHTDLRQAHAHLGEARLAATGSFEWKCATGEIVWSKEMYRIFAVDRTSRPTAEIVVSRTHPEDRARIQRLIDRVTREVTDWSVEHRLLMPDGVVKHLHVVAHPVHDATGATEYVGAVLDVTPANQSRQALESAGAGIRESTVRLPSENVAFRETIDRTANEELQRTLDAIPHAITILAPDGRTLGANAFVLDYTGLSLEEVRADESRARRFHPDDVARIEEERQEGFSRGEPFEAELRGRRKDGQYRWFLIRYNPLRDDDGTIIRWYATGTDIDDRKLAEDRVRGENLALREEVDRSSMFEEIVGASRPLRTVLSHVSKVAPTDSTVLITGETGTGKELIARAIHKRSPRSARAFVAVNCGAIPPTLIASELFGHEKGAFTGALQRRQGRFELADGGTLFLDEVGELPAETQIMLLRVLQEREFERVGGSGPIRVNVRVIAATNRDLQDAVADGTFRADLFYRLNVFPLDVPALRERPADVPLLVEYFTHRYAKRVGKRLRSVTRETSHLLQSYDWPGNIRELQNVIERAVIVCDSDTLSIDARWLSGRPLASPPVASLATGTLATHEKDAIEAALKESKGRVAGPFGAATRLGVPGSTLESKIKALKIDKRRFKAA
jgi:PAS domain S-box-containing protein